MKNKWNEITFTYAFENKFKKYENKNTFEEIMLK